MSLLNDDYWFGADNTPSVVPAVVFKTRVLSEWVDVNSYDLFSNKRVILFALPGAFTPTCSSKQLPGFEEKYDEFKALGIDEIYCLSCNDSFTMNAWAESLNIKNVKMIPDGSNRFTRRMNMLVEKDNLGFGDRSWRYAAIVNNGKIEQLFEEPGKRNNADDDSYTVSSPENVLDFLNGVDKAPF